MSRHGKLFQRAADGGNAAKGTDVEWTEEGGRKPGDREYGPTGSPVTEKGLCWQVCEVGDVNRQPGWHRRSIAFVPEKRIPWMKAFFHAFQRIHKMIKERMVST